MYDKKTFITLISNASAYGGVATHLNQFGRVLFLHFNIKKIMLFCSTKIEVSEFPCPVSIHKTTESLLSGLYFFRFFIIPLNFLRELMLVICHVSSCWGRNIAVVSHDPNSFWGFILLAKKAKYFLFVTPDLSSMQRQSSEFKFYIYKVWRKILNLLVIRLIKQKRLTLIAPTQFAADIWALYLGIDVGFLQIFPNPPFLKNPFETIIRDTQLPDARASQWQELHRSGKKIILSVGMMVDYKNPDSWAKIVKKIQTKRDDLVWIWAGDGPELEKTRSELKDVPGAFAIGRLNQKDLKDLYDVSRIFFHPAIRESQGLVVMDALTYGIPVILNNSEALPGLIAGTEAGLVVQCENHDAADIIIEYINTLDNKEIYQKISKAASALAIERYSYDKWQENLKKLLQA